MVTFLVNQVGTSRVSKFSFTRKIVIFIVIYSVLNQPIIDITSSEGYSNLHWGLSSVYFFMILGVCTLIREVLAQAFPKAK